MQTGFNTTSRQLVFVLPVFMGIIEYVLRVGFDQPGKDEFFPISLVVAGIGLFIAMTSLQDSPSEARQDDRASGVPCGQTDWRRQWDSAFAASGIWLSAAGVVCWIYLLAASFSESVQDIVPYYPLCAAVFYYGLGAGLTEWKARMSKR